MLVIYWCVSMECTFVLYGVSITLWSEKAISQLRCLDLSVVSVYLCERQRKERAEENGKGDRGREKEKEGERDAEEDENHSIGQVFSKF